MTPRQRNILITLTILVAVTRWWAMSRTIWDWDEAQFATGVRSFDVVEHHPHPPGFPLFIVAGKAVNLAVGDEWRSLQLISLAGACLLFPAAFFLAFELGFGFGVSLGGALMTVFAPSVWFYGGTAFSDIPSLALVMTASALLLMSRHRGSSFLLGGALLLGISAGVRSQNLAIGFFPFLLAAWPRVRSRQWRTVLAAALLIAVVVIASYIGAGMASYSWSEYQITLKQHREYIVATDSYRGPVRPPLRQLFDDFFMRIFQFWRVSLAIFFLAMLSVIDAFVRRRKPPLYLLATFGPFAISAYLILDFNSTTRFSIGYLPMFAILGADGIGAVAGWLRLRPWMRDAAASIGGGLLAIGMVIWALPGILEARRTISPPKVAIQWIRQNLSPQTATIYVAKAMKAIAEYELADYRLVRVQDERGVPLAPSEAENAWLLAEGITMEPTGLNFLRSRESRLWRIARRRYFEISIIPLARRAQFLEGWHEAENEGADAWRWMGRRSVTMLPSQSAPAKLRLRFTVPLDAIPAPNVRILMNGAEIGRLHPTTRRADFEAVLRSTNADSPNELVIETDQWVNPKEKGISDDARELALRLEDMSWGPGT